MFLPRAATSSTTRALSRSLRSSYSRQLIIPFSTYGKVLSPSIDSVNEAHSEINEVPVDTFRRHTFELQEPLVIRACRNTVDAPGSTIPAAAKWFKYEDLDQSEQKRSWLFNLEYLEQYGDTLLPYEFVAETRKDSQKLHQWLSDCSENNNIGSYLPEDFDRAGFHRFYAPLRLLLSVSRLGVSSSRRLPGLYIAQAQIMDLPPGLAVDLPTPRVVLQAGSGSIYDSNVWLGCPPTYTPLHKDPNPNLFVQLAGEKEVRLFRPTIGMHIFSEVQRRIGRNASPRFRGDEMMFGPEREALHHAVWTKPEKDGYEVTMGPGDALMIPRGWWHSIRSTGTSVNGSVNWWFR